jgi:hypothetical protein
MTKFLRLAAPHFLTLSAMLSASPFVLADIKVERPIPQANQQVISVPVDVAYAKPNGNPTAKIVIPLETLKALAEAAKANKSLTLPLGVSEPSEPTSGFPHGGTIIAGLAISLAMMSMVYLLRRKPAQRWAVTGTAVVLLGLGVTSYLWADIRVPGQPYKGPARRPETAPIVAPQPAGPMVTIEIAEKGDKILITVPPAAP